MKRELQTGNKEGLFPANSGGGKVLAPILPLR